MQGGKSGQVSEEVLAVFLAKLFSRANFQEELREVGEIFKGKESITSLELAVPGFGSVQFQRYATPPPSSTLIAHPPTSEGETCC